MKKKKPSYLDHEERKILREFEQGEFESIRNVRAEKMGLEEAAKNAIQKTESDV